MSIIIVPSLTSLFPSKSPNSSVDPVSPFKWFVLLIETSSALKTSAVNVI
jgi:hypothetical protein